jgi:hypothetical protein
MNRIASFATGRTPLFLVAAIAVAVAVAATAIAVPASRDGGTITGVKVVHDSEFFRTRSTSFMDLPGASTQITVPSGKRALILARFSSVSGCVRHGRFGGGCLVRILIGGVQGEPGVERAEFDSAGFGEDLRESHAIERSRMDEGGLPAGTYEVKVQWRAENNFVEFLLYNWHLTVERAIL